jgi:hypothetical protein
MASIRIIIFFVVNFFESPPYPYNYKLFFASKSSKNITLSSHVLTLLRIKYFKPSQEQIEQKLYPDVTKALSYANEVSAMHDLATVIKIGISKNPFGAAFDKTKLDLPQFSTFEKIAMRCRMEEKEILMAILPFTSKINFTK